MEKFKGRSTLKLIQSIKTVPSAFPTTMNTCGRICVHQSGRFVIVSNRGHESIAIFRVKQGSGSHKKSKSKRGSLAQVGFVHTRGETPRHFQFDHSGQFLLVANQDSDTIATFTFNLTSGEIKYTGNEYRVPSPNFVCCCPLVDRYSDDDDADQPYQKVSEPYLVRTETDMTSLQPPTSGNSSLVAGGIGGTVPSSVEFLPTIKSSSDVLNDLENARKEIDELKKQLATLTADRS